MKSKFISYYLLFLFLILFIGIFFLPKPEEPIPAITPKVESPIPVFQVPVVKKPVLDYRKEIIVGSEITPENIFNGVNKERQKIGLPLLKRNSTLDQVANDKLQDILQYQYFKHTNPVTGSTPWIWFEKESYDFKYAGEILAENYKTTQETIAAWMNSATHKKQIIKGEYKETGIAVQGSLVVEVFGTKI